MSLIERAALLLPRSLPHRAEADAFAEAIDDLPAAGRGPRRAERQHLALGPVLTIDSRVLAAQSLLVPGTPANQLEGEFRIIKRPLILNATGARGRKIANGRRVMVTSSLPGEGKTYCAINLALSMAAERDLGVLLIDADVARPAVHSRLGLPEAAGLMDALFDPDLDPATLVHPTNIPGLSIMLAGTRHNRATELLASADMKRLVHSLASRFSDCMLVFDAPPLLATTESRVMASHVGQVVLVVERGRTPRAAVRSSLAALENCDPAISLLLNKAPPRGRRATARYGSYSTDYGYG